MGYFETFANRCKVRVFTSVFCFGVKLDQLTFDFQSVVTGQVVVKRYKDPHEYLIDKTHFCKTNGFSKQKLNYGRRAKNRH